MKVRIVLWLLFGILFFQLPIGAVPITSQNKRQVENKYGVVINMDKGYLSEEYIIRVIDETLDSFPQGLVKEVTDFYKAKGISTQINIQYKLTQLGGTFHIGGKTAQINIYPNPMGNPESVTIAHEMGHYLHEYIQDKGDKARLKEEWIRCNEAYAYTGNKWTEVERNYENYFLNAYSTQSYSEDFATLIEYLVGRPNTMRDFLMQRNPMGIKQKINVLNKWLMLTCNNIVNVDHIWNDAVPQQPSLWAQGLCQKAEEAGLVPEPMNVTHPSFEGLYQSRISRVSFCRLVENLIEKKLEKTLSEVAFANGKKEKWYEYSTMDIETMEVQTTGNLPFEDTGAFYVFDLYAMGIISGTGNKIFNPNKPLSLEQVATILERTAKIMGLDYIDKQMVLQGIEGNENINELCTYEQAYIAVLNVFDAKLRTN